MSCLVCSLPRLVGLLGLFNSPYPSRTPKLSQWSDRPRRVGLGPQFLSRGLTDCSGGHCWGCRSVMSCLVCSLPRLVGLLGLFNSPYPSRTPKLSQWSDRPRRVGVGPQFLSRGSLTARDSVVIGRRWGFILCGCLSSTWCARWDGILLTDCRGGHCMPLTRTTVEVFWPPLLLALWPRMASCQRPVTPCAEQVLVVAVSV